MSLENTRLLIVVDNVDYREALSHIFMPEQLNEQLSGRVSPVDIHILTAAVRWSEQVQEVAIFSCYSSEMYSESTYLKVRIMGSGLAPAGSDNPQETTSSLMGKKRERQLLSLVGDFCPNRVVMCTRSPAILQWATRNKIRTLALFSDWQEPLGFLQRWQHRKFVRQLNRQSVEWVGGHGVQASRVLAENGIESGKLIPWEWSQPQLLSQYSPKPMREHNASIELIYVGELDDHTGIDDLLQATGHLQKGDYTVSLQLIRNTLNHTSPVAAHETAWLETKVQALGLADAVTVWAGLAPDQILERVRAADLAVIPEPPAQVLASPPLGVSLAMAACTPIVACDHPNLDNHLLHSFNAIIFPRGNPKSMAHRIERIMGQPALYAQLSEASETALSKIKVPARWQELIEQWMQDTVYDQQWMSNFALSSGRYQPIEVQRDSLSIKTAT